MWVNYINPMGILFRGFCGRILCRCFHSRRPTWNCNNNSKRRWRGSEWGGTLQGTNISPKNGILKMIFLFPRWDMLIPWRVSKIPWVIAESDLEPNTPGFQAAELRQFSSNSRPGRWFFKTCKTCKIPEISFERSTRKFPDAKCSVSSLVSCWRMHLGSQMSRFLSQASEKNSELEVMGGFIKSGTWMGFNKNDMLSNASIQHCFSNTTISLEHVDVITWLRTVYFNFWCRKFMAVGMNIVFSMNFNMSINFGRSTYPQKNTPLKKKPRETNGW